MKKSGRPSEVSLSRYAQVDQKGAFKEYDRQLRLWLSGISADIRMLFDLTNAITPVSPSMATSVSNPEPSTPSEPGTPGTDGAVGPPGPPGTTSVDAVAAEDLLAGQPVYPDGVTGQFKLANASALATANVVGLIAVSMAATFMASAQQLMLTLADWTAATGAAALSPGSSYFLATTPGQITTIAPTTVGQVVTRLGIAVSVQTLALDIQEPILL